MPYGGSSELAISFIALDAGLVGESECVCESSEMPRRLDPAGPPSSEGGGGGPSSTSPLGSPPSKLCVVSSAGGGGSNCVPSTAPADLDLDLPFDDHSEMIERPRFLGFRLIGGFAAARYGARGGFGTGHSS